MSERKKRKNKCSGCGRLSRDHLGPVGKKCTRSPLHLDEESDAGSLYDSSSKHDGVLHELADQLGKLTVHIQSVQDDLQDVKKQVCEVRYSSGKDSEDKNPGTSSFLGSAPDYMSAGSSSSAATTEASMCLPSGACVSLKILSQAKNGEYINLTDFMPWGAGV